MGSRGREGLGRERGEGRKGGLDKV
jgi:hypothetical protein